MTQASVHLKKIKTLIQQFSEKGSKCLVVFDLDSTLFDVSPRIEQILVEFGNNKEFQKRFPDSCAILQSIKTHPTDWGIKDALVRAGLDGHHPDFQTAIKNFWSKTFFSNEYLKYDRPYAGACEFVSSVLEIGADVTYLSARDIGRMGPGSSAILKMWKFPVDTERAQLVLKSHVELDDAQFKSDYFSSAKNRYEKIWFFENEPVNIEIVRNQHPEVELVFFKSTHSQRAKTPIDLPTIIHYLMD